MLMYTGIISFCDRIRYNIKSSETKDAILSDLERKYNIRILQRHWYKLDETTAPQLKKTPHWACLRSNGNPYYMFFTRFDDVNIIYFIDKKVQPGYEKPRIILGRGMFHDDLFNDTILDGEMVRRTDQPGWVFLVNDVIAYCGHSLRDVVLPKRISYAYDLFHTKHKPDPFFDVCIFSIKKYVHPTKNVISELMKLSEILPYTNRGVYFWCHNNKLKPKLFNFDDGLIKSVHRKVKDCPEFRNRNEPENETTRVEKEEKEKEESKENKTLLDTKHTVLLQQNSRENRENRENKEDETGKLLWLRKTENPDIFDIFTTQQCTDKVGNAYIASLLMSKRLRTIFKDLTVAIGVPFLCSYNKQFEKWSPIKQMEISEVK